MPNKNIIWSRKHLLRCWHDFPVAVLGLGTTIATPGVPGLPPPANVSATIRASGRVFGRNGVGDFRCFSNVPLAATHCLVSAQSAPQSASRFSAQKTRRLEEGSEAAERRDNAD
jgi:hypothetical protein